METAAASYRRTPDEGDDGIGSNRTMTPRVVVASRAGAGLRKKAKDLSGRRVPSQLRLLEEWHAIAGDLEPTAPRWLHGDGGVREPVANRGRQTGGPGLVVSNRAVFDVDLHEPNRDWRKAVRSGARYLPSGSSGGMISGGFGGIGIP
jgi:hypothetical protein